MKPQSIENHKLPPEYFNTLQASKENRKCSNLSTSQEVYTTPQKVTPPTDYCRIKHLAKAQNSPPHYFLNSRLLEFLDILPHVRERMITWLMQQSSKRYLQRQTYVLAISLMDLYMMKGGSITTQKIQQLGIACLNLACKYNQSFTRPIHSNPNLFSQQSIYQFELDILKKMKYKLNPANYASIARNLLCSWDSSVGQYEQLKNIKFCCGKAKNLSDSKEIKMIVKVQRFYQLLDCCFGVKQMLDYDAEDLVYNSFVVFVRGQQYISPATTQIFEHQLKQALVTIFRSSSQTPKEPVLLDEPLQKLIQIPYNLLKQNQKTHLTSKKTFLSSVTVSSVQNCPHLAPEYLYMIQSFQTSLLKTIKQSAKQIEQLQSTFQTEIRNEISALAQDQEQAAQVGGSI